MNFKRAGRVSYLYDEVHQLTLHFFAGVGCSSNAYIDRADGQRESLRQMLAVGKSWWKITDRISRDE